MSQAAPKKQPVTVTALPKLLAKGKTTLLKYVPAKGVGSFYKYGTSMHEQQRHEKEATKKARHFLEQWLKFVNNADVESLLGLYNKGAVLIPTFSNETLSTPEKIRGYFEKLGDHEGLKVTLHEKTLVVQKLQKQTLSLSGLYNWRFKVEGEERNFEARFSYLIDLSKNSPILHHHSSQSPHSL